MARKKTREPTTIRAEDIDPHHDWTRPLQAPGHMRVGFELIVLRAMASGLDLVPESVPVDDGLDGGRR